MTTTVAVGAPALSGSRTALSSLHSCKQPNQACWVCFAAGLLSAAVSPDTGTLGMTQAACACVIRARDRRMIRVATHNTQHDSQFAAVLSSVCRMLHPCTVHRLASLQACLHSPTTPASPQTVCWCAPADPVQAPVTQLLARTAYPKGAGADLSLSSTHKPSTT
jgi:hypothetical protein